MDKKNILEKYKYLLIIFGVMIVGFVLIFFSSPKKESQHPINEKELVDEVEEHGLHEHYNKDTDNSEFAKQDGEEVIVSRYTLSRLKSIEGSTIENTNPRFLDVKGEYLLIKSHKGYLYLYNMNLNEGYKIAEGVTHGIISNDKKFIIFTMRSSYTSGQYIYYAIIDEALGGGKIATIPQSEPITNLMYLNGEVYYTNKYFSYGEKEPFITSLAVIPSFQTNYTPDELITNVNNTSQGFDILDNNVVIFSKKDNAFSTIHPGLNNSFIKIPIEEKIKEVIDFDINNNENWVLAENTSPDEKKLDFSKLRTSNGIIEKFKRTSEVQWIDNESFILLDDGVLYLYDTIQMKHYVIYPRVENFKIDNNKIYIQLVTDDIYYMNIKKKK